MEEKTNNKTIINPPKDMELVQNSNKIAIGELHMESINLSMQDLCGLAIHMLQDKDVINYLTDLRKRRRTMNGIG